MRIFEQMAGAPKERSHLAFSKGPKSPAKQSCRRAAKLGACESIWQARENEQGAERRNANFRADGGSTEERENNDEIR